jgi:hypothetical protein
MIRKLALAFAATAALGTASLAVSTTPAEAKKGFHHHHGHGHHHHWHGHRFYGLYGAGLAAAAYSGCYVKRVVYTPVGPRIRWINVCF